MGDQMKFRDLVGTTIRLPTAALGTVGLGLDYGIRGTGAQPSRCDAIKILQRAADNGFSLIDTAPNYGDAESIVGEALGARQDCMFATKVNIPRDHNGRLLSGRKLFDSIQLSLRTSRTALRRDCLDIVQIHNATTDVLKNGEVVEALSRARDEGSIKVVGVSVYTEEEAIVALSDERIKLVQMPFSMLDQRPRNQVTHLARKHRVGLLARSILLKGVLTERALLLPAQLVTLREAAQKAKQALSCPQWSDLTKKAMRFCFFCDDLASALVGVSTQNELDLVFSAYQDGPLSSEESTIIEQLYLTDAQLLNPQKWETI